MFVIIDLLNVCLCLDMFYIVVVVVGDFFNKEFFVRMDGLVRLDWSLDELCKMVKVGEIGYF